MIAVGTHDSDGGVEDTFVQRLDVVGFDQLGADFLDMVGGSEFRL
jgi:hypothetical protein